MIKALLLALALGGQLVDQGAPGTQGPWPVYFPTFPDGGGGSGSPYQWCDGGAGTIAPCRGEGYTTPNWGFGDGGEPWATQNQVDAGLHSIQAGGWVTAYDCDYTKQPPVSVTSNQFAGATSICGVPYNINVAQSGSTYADAIAVLPDGGGLSILTDCSFGGSSIFGSPLQPDAGTHNFNARWSFGIDSLISNLSFSTPIRVTAYFVPFTTASNSEGCLMQFDNGGNNANFTEYGYGEGYYSVAGVVDLSAVGIYNSTASRVDNTSGAGVTDNILQFTVVNGMLFQAASFTSQVLDGGFPAPQDTYNIRSLANTAVGSPALVPTMTTPSAFLIGGQSVCAFRGTNPCTLLRLKVEYKN